MVRTDGRSRQGRTLPPTYHITRAEPLLGQTAYRINFGHATPGLVMHGVRTAREYEKPLTVLVPADGTSITVYLDSPDDNLALLRWLTATFRPETHHGVVQYHTHGDSPHMIVWFVDDNSTDDLWGVAAMLAGLEGVAGVDVKNGQCIVDLAPGVDDNMAWELLHDIHVQTLVVFDSRQAPPE